MTIYEILSLNSDLLKKFHALGIETTDYELIKIYEDYMQMLEAGEKITYIIATLAERYGKGERTIYRIVKHLRTDCQIVAVTKT